jgi:hypothetical protein
MRNLLEMKSQLLFLGKEASQFPALDAKRGQMIRVWLQRLYELTFSPSAEFLKKHASFLRFSLSRERQLGIHLKSALGWLAGRQSVSIVDVARSKFVL